MTCFSRSWVARGPVVGRSRGWSVTCKRGGYERHKGRGRTGQLQRGIGNTGGWRGR
jgi:hypothetical protein